jgi:hypothetical protein
MSVFYRVRRAAGFWFALPLVCASSLSFIATANDSPAPFPEGDASLSSVGMPHIPEPLLFDLVRPLGARKGELEINALAQHDTAGGHREWAPEIEYAFADGLAIEAELPFENGRLEQYKIAVQGTLGTFRENTMVHGWQTIVRRERDSGDYSADALYLHGMTFGDSWSLFSMGGLRRDLANNGSTVGLLNASVFYDWSQRLTFGLEINSEIGSGLNGRSRLIPQVHYDLGPQATLQAGLGPSWLRRDGGDEEWLLSWRLIYAW